MSSDRNELDALLVKQATEGLDAAETRRLARLLGEYPELDPEWADRAVGEIDAASVSGAEAKLSPKLRASLLEAAGQTPMGSGSRTSTRITPTRAPARIMSWLGWAAAAAVGALWVLDGGPTGADAVDFQSLASAEDAVVVDWSPGPDPTGADVEGQVVWSSASQAGVMRLAGLAVNAPDEFQYQLWIFDRERDIRYPVDGGVFDMPPGGEAAEVAVQAKLDVVEPTLFAVTVEQPGGVVVSNRERVATVAEVLD